MLAFGLIRDRDKSEYRRVEIPDVQSLIGICRAHSFFWDLDHTVLQSTTDPKPVVIGMEHNPKLHPDLLYRKEDVGAILTGRHWSRADDTLQVLLHLGLKPDIILMNPVEKYDPEHLDFWKSRICFDIGAVAYIDDDPQVQYRWTGRWSTRVMTVSRLVWGGV